MQNLQHVFRTELVKERIADNMNRLVRLEKNPLLRAVPLEIKNLFLLAGTTLGGRSISAIYSNIGKSSFRMCLRPMWIRLDFLQVRTNCRCAPALTGIK